MVVNGNKEWICCLGCGRETQAKHGYCSHCISGRHMPNEKRGRPVVNYGREPLKEIETSGIHEDDYSEDAMGPVKPEGGAAPGSDLWYPNAKAEARHLDMMKRRTRNIVGRAEDEDCKDAQ